MDLVGPRAKPDQDPRLASRLRVAVADYGHLGRRRRRGGQNSCEPENVNSVGCSDFWCTLAAEKKSEVIVLLNRTRLAVCLRMLRPNVFRAGPGAVSCGL